MIKELLKNKPHFQTVFTLNEIAQLVAKPSDTDLINSVHYFVKKGELLHLAKGIYSLSPNYSAKELGNKLRTPSYVSLYTVLQESGVVFQPYTSVFLASNRSEKRTIGSQTFIYRKIKDEILLNKLGLYEIDGVTHAMTERAIADKIYLDGIEHFDNLRPVNWEFLALLNQDVYKSKSIQQYIKYREKE